MKAMVLAAGLGTRLRPVTDSRPKALVEVAGRTLLDLTLTRLRAFGIREVILNVHHFADMVIDYLTANSSFGMQIEVSREDVLLDTGGGLKKAAWFFLNDSGPSGGAPFILHNVDVISTIDLGRMAEFHRKHNAVATLAVQNRSTSRYLLFDADAQLCGRRLIKEGKTELVRPVSDPAQLAFGGVHVISPHLLTKLSEEGVFSIITSYLRLAGEGERVLGFPADEYYWMDLGKPENLLQAERERAMWEKSLGAR